MRFAAPRAPDIRHRQHPYTTHRIWTHRIRCTRKLVCGTTSVQSTPRILHSRRRRPASNTIDRARHINRTRSNRVVLSLCIAASLLARLTAPAQSQATARTTSGRCQLPMRLQLLRRRLVTRMRLRLHSTRQRHVNRLMRLDRRMLCRWLVARGLRRRFRRPLGVFI